MRTINEIIVHCSATPEGRDYSAKDIDRWHRARGWSKIGYHYVIRLNGDVEIGRTLAEIGAHCQGRNAHSIGVCYIGGLAADGKTPKDTRTMAQKQALLKLLRSLKKQFPEAHILGHRDTSPDLNHNGKVDKAEWVKACPSFDAEIEYKDI